MEFVRLRDDFKRELKKEKIAYYANQFSSCIGDISKIWRLSNSLCGRDSKSVRSSIELLIGGDIVGDRWRVANEFNSYFTCVNDGLVCSDSLSTVDSHSSSSHSLKFFVSQVWLRSNRL
jgi:hypothetical protein